MFGTEIFCKNQRTYNATDCTGTHTIPLEDIIGSMNASLRGWINYFHYHNSSAVLSKVKTHAEKRLRIHLMKRHKVKDHRSGLDRLPSKQLYEKWAIQSSDNSYACLSVKNIGKPCAGKPHTQFDEGGKVKIYSPL